MEFIFLIVICSFSTTAFSEGGWSFSEQVNKILQFKNSKEILELSLDSKKELLRTKQWNFLPTVSAIASQDRQTTRNGDFSGVNSSTLGADFRINLFRFGGDVASRMVARHQIEGLAIKSNFDKIAAESEAATIITDAIAAKMLVQVYEKRVATAQKAIIAAEFRFRKGLLSQQELSKMKVDQANLQLAKERSLLSFAQKSQLLELMGGQLPPEVNWPLSSEIVRKARLPDWIKSTTGQSAELQGLEAEAKSADALVLEARSETMPTIDFGASWRKQYANLDLGRQNQDSSNVNLTITMPLFSRFSDYSQYRSRVCDAAQIRYKIESLRRIVGLKAKIAADTLANLLAEAIERDQQILIVDQLYRDNLMRFERGLISVNELSIDENRVRDAEISSIETWQKAHEQLFQLSELTGIPVVSLF